MFEIITLAVLSAVGGVLVAASLGPNTWRIQRSARINARPENIYGQQWPGAILNPGRPI